VQQIVALGAEAADWPAECPDIIKEYFDLSETWLRLYEGLSAFVVRKQKDLAPALQQQIDGVAAAPVLVVEKVGLYCTSVLSLSSSTYLVRSVQQQAVLHCSGTTLLSLAQC
jgi:hypothetical protein